MLLHFTQMGFDKARGVAGAQTLASGDDGTLLAIESSVNDVSLKLIDLLVDVGVTGAELVKRV